MPEKMHNPHEEYNHLLKPLCFLLQRSRMAYTDYLGAKKYWQAAVIRQSNREVYRLLLTRASFIPDVLQEDVAELMNHYNAWFLQFRRHKKKTKPGLDDEFVFGRLEAQPAFPGKAEENIFTYTQQLRQELAHEVTTG